MILPFITRARYLALLEDRENWIDLYLAKSRILRDTKRELILAQEEIEMLWKQLNKNANAPQKRNATGQWEKQG